MRARPSFHRSLPWLAVLVLLALPGGAASAEPPDRGTSFTFEVATPPLELVPVDGGLAEIRLRGFGRHDGAAGTPDVPIRTVLVAIPDGATPRLSVRLAGERSTRTVTPSPVPRVVPVGVDGDDRARSLGRASVRELASRPTRRIYEPSPADYSGEGTLPSRVAWLGSTGVLRNQRYVEVHLAPVRYDRGAGGLVVDSALEVTVHFDGNFDTAVAPADEDAFEPVYREAFVNYSQGREFRMRPGERGLPEPLEATGSVSGPIRRIRVREDGPVRLDYDLFATQAPEFLASDPATWRLMNRGVAVPLQIHQDPLNNSMLELEQNEWVQFYGEALDDEPDTVLNYDNPLNPATNLYAARDFTDENVYFLTVATEAQPSMTERDASPPVGTPEASFTDTAHVEVDDTVAPNGQSFFFPHPDELLFWLPFVNQFSPPRSDEVPLPGMVGETLPIQVRVRVRGFIDCSAVDPDHKTLVRLENDFGETLILPASNPDNQGNQNVGEFDGNTLFVHDFEWTHAGSDPELTDPLHVTLAAANLTGGCASGEGLNNENLLDYIEIDYEREFIALDDRLTFAYPDGDALFEITGFDSSAVEVYEVTDEIGTSGVTDAVRLTGVDVFLDGSDYTARFRMDDEGNPGTLRRFVAVGHAGIPVPSTADFEADRVSTLISDTTPAKLVVIAHPDLLSSECTEGGACSYDADCTGSENDRCEIANGSVLDLLLAHRASQDVSSRVVRIQDIYDEFNYGLPGPVAIQNFLGWLAAGGWDGEIPAYVVVLGDGSYDYKGGEEAGNFVPTQIMVKDGKSGAASILPHYPSDNLLAAVAGDDHLADMGIGRLTARTLGEAEDILSKILTYEQAPAADGWRSSVLFISDRGHEFDEQEGLAFEAMNDFAESFLPDSGYSSTKLRYWSDNCGGHYPPDNCDPLAMKQDILDHVNAVDGDGAAMVQFVGHGNFDLWSDDVFFCANEESNFCVSDDTTSLTNVDKLPWLVVHNCLTGGFHLRSAKSFGEQWLKIPFGGAPAVFAPSGLGYRFIGNDVIEVLWDEVFGPPKRRIIAEPVLASLVHLCTQGSVEACQFYTLLGDPATVLALPHVGPPSNPAATPSTGETAEVELTWDPSSTPGAVYDVYRTEQLDLPYAKVNASPIDGTSFTDGTVEHADTYYYYVVAVDAGFESAWSNFNTDCGETPASDCLQAEPLNLVPPDAPGGLTVVDAETGGALIVSWDANSEPDLANYIVHYGLTPEMDQTTTVFKNVNQLTLTGLEDHSEYQVAIQARNTSGTESALSPTVTATPNLVLGVKSPGWIRDLRIGKSKWGPDAQLSWEAVTEDIYGKPLVVSHYEVYRDTDPQFLPNPGNLIGTPTGPGFLDPGALDPAGPNYHYLVRAVDAAGNPGGLGRQLPAGILDLVLQWSTVPEDEGLFLIWSAVTTDFDDQPTQITHYEVWAADVPVTREAIEEGAAWLDLIVPAADGAMVEIVPAPQNRYYSVLAVDVRGNRSPF